MRKPALATAALAAALALAAPLAAQDRFAGVRIQVVPLGPGDAMLIGAGGNIGVCSGPDGCVLIDDQFAPLAPRIRAAVDSVSGGKPIRFVLNTHYHGDHVGGNAPMAAAGAVIVAQDNVRKRMSVTQFRASFGDTVQPSPPGALPVVTFPDSLTFHLNGHTLEVFHVRNAHTDGDVMVHFLETDVLHMGDCFFNGRYPVIDVSAGGSIDGMVAADDVALKLAGPRTRLVPGHGPLGDREQLQRFRDMLATVSARVKRLIRDGRTLPQILEAKPLADLDPTWGTGSMKADRFLGVVYADLSRPGRAR